MKNLLVYSGLCLLLFSCGSAKTYTVQELQDYEDLKSLVDSKSLQIISNSASPFASAAFSRVANSNILGPGNSANYIDISTNANKLVIKGDSIQGYLPFFGEQNFGGGYNGNNTSIAFDDIPTDYQVLHDAKKQTVELRFRIDDEHRNSEHYDMRITLYPNMKSTINVQSTTRTSIEYTGRLSALKEVKE